MQSCKDLHLVKSLIENDKSLVEEGNSEIELYFIKQSLIKIKQELLKHIANGVIVYFLNW